MTKDDLENTCGRNRKTGRMCRHGFMCSHRQRDGCVVCQRYDRLAVPRSARGIFMGKGKRKSK